MGKFFRFTLPLGIILLSIVAVVVMVKVAAGKRPERAEDPTAAVLVDTITAESRSVNLVVRTQGAVRPRTETVLVSEVSGKVVEVSPDFVAGGFFRAGEVLLQVDPADYQTALKRAQASLASRQARYTDEKARSEQALKDWNNLGREGQPSDLVVRKPQLADALANVQAAEADVEKARRDLARTRISAPYDGLVRQKRVDIGQYVTPGTQLGVSFAIDSAEIRLPLSAADLQFIELPSAHSAQTGAFPKVRLSAEEGGKTRSWEASIIRTEGVLDEASRVLYAVAQVVDPYAVLGQSTQDELRMGTFVRAEIEGKFVENVVVLPRFVLQTDNTVLVANDERKLEVRDVSIARAEPRFVYITGGVADGEKIITTTLDAPIPGTSLAISGEPLPATESDDSVASTRPDS